MKYLKHIPFILYLVLVAAGVIRTDVDLQTDFTDNNIHIGLHLETAWGKSPEANIEPEVMLACGSEQGNSNCT